jgi:hypothetical protein
MVRAVAFALLLVAGIARAAVSPAMSGTWYDPAHSGHGLSIQVIDANRAIAYWFVYDRDGAPVHLYVDGRIEGRTIRGDTYAPRGMQFGVFDRSTLQVPRWGNVAIEFASCDRATLTYDANGEAGLGFGIGSLPLARLSGVAGLASCDESAFVAADVGAYPGTFLHRAGGRGTLDAVIDNDGHLWALTSGLLVPGPGAIGFVVPGVIVPDLAQTGRPGLRHGRVLPNIGFDQSVRLTVEDLGQISVAFDGSGNGSGLSSGGSRRNILDVEVTRSSARSAELAGRLDLASLAGRYGAMVSGVVFPLPLDATFSANGTVCLAVSGGTCQYYGTLAVRSATHRFFDFELLDNTEHRTFRGRGWVYAEGGRPTRVVMVGSGPGDRGFGITLTRN